MADVIEARGYNGQVEFDGRTVTIKREGFLARASQGRSEKSLALRQISAVQFKPAGVLSNGFIQFTIPGEISESVHKGGRAIDAAGDENAVLFTRKQSSAFASLRDLIRQTLNTLA